MGCGRPQALFRMLAVGMSRLQGYLAGERPELGQPGKATGTRARSMVYGLGMLSADREGGRFAGRGQDVG